MSASPSSLTVLTQSAECRAAWKGTHTTWTNPSPFLHPVFQDGLERIVTWKRLVLTTPGDALLSTFVRSRGLVRDLVLPPFQPFSAIGPVADPLDLIRRLRSSPDLPSDWILSITPEQYAALHPKTMGRGIRVVERYTYHLSSGPFEVAIASWSAAQRRQVRKSVSDFVFWCSHDLARTAGSEAKKLDEVIQRAVFLADSAYRRAGRRLPLPPRALARWARDLVYAGLARVYGLHDRHTGEIVAAIVALHDERTAWYWIAGSKPGPGMTVLMAHVQDELHAAGIATLDLMGANTPGIAEFKRRFGGQHVTYAHVSSRSLIGGLTNSMAHFLTRLTQSRTTQRISEQRSEAD